MKNICIIQARLGSDRLPGKVMQPIGDGKSIVEMAYARLCAARYIDKVVVAIPEGEKDDRLAAFLDSKNIPYLRGSEDDVLGRFCTALGDEEWDNVIRATSDNPFVSTYIADAMVLSHILSGSDYTSAGDAIIGTSVEVAKADKLRELNARTDLQGYHREHVTFYFREHPETYHLNTLPVATCKGLKGKIRLTVDTVQDYEVACGVYAAIGRPDLDIPDVLALYAEQPDLFVGNKDVVQKVR